VRGRRYVGGEIRSIERVGGVTQKTYEIGVTGSRSRLRRPEGGDSWAQLRHNKEKVIWRESDSRRPRLKRRLDFGRGGKRF